MKSHRTDPVSLIFALIFLMVVGWWALAQAVDFSLPQAGWLLAGALIVFGVLGLVGALRSGRSAPHPATDAGPDPSASTTGAVRDPSASTTDPVTPTTGPGPDPRPADAGREHR